MEHLWNHLTLVKRRVTESEPVLILLDYDGTLAPIADTPQKACLPATIGAKLRSLSQIQHYRLGIVSGRPVDEVMRLVGIEGIIYTGNHGLELADPQGRWVQPKAAALRPQLEKVIQELAGGELGRVPGVLIEDKGVTVSVHYRLVADERQGAIEPAVCMVLRSYGTLFQLTHGKKVLEVRPNVPCHKGTAVWSIARLVGVSQGGLIIYIGDDYSDEHAFAALRPSDVSIRVGAEAPSRAIYFLRDTEEVGHFLASLAHWGAKHRGSEQAPAI